MTITPKTQRYGTNWEEQFQASEVGVRKEDGKEMRVVYLRGLQRLAQEAGIVRSRCQFNFIPKDQTGSVGIMQAVYEAEFSDGTIWVGTADCNSANTSGKFMAYPTAVAESRAEARCLRKALNIGIMSSEEVGFVDGGAIEQIAASTSKQIDSQVVKAIEKLCESRNATTAEVLEAILSKERNSSVFELGELTVEEGQKAMAWLNDRQPTKAKPTKLSAAEEREARKKELQAQADKDNQ
jgi:hypothetical protein